jgi:uncharacterized protein YqjF (DUF2071 family)
MERGFLGAAARQAHLLDELDHRPWPAPATDWLEAQSRENVLFVHWQVDLDAVARLVPPGLAIDTFEGGAWLGAVAFRLSNLRLRGLPPVPRLAFDQFDVVIPVVVDDRPGLWLCSLDASSRTLAEAAKRVHRLPAYRARFRRSEDGAGDPGALRSVEVDREGARFRASFRPAAGEPFVPVPGSLEHHLTERYGLYTADGGRLYRADLHHAPWLLTRAEVQVEEATLLPALVEGAPHALWARTQDVLVWPLEEL